jgi:hypothetical protein
MKAEVHILGDNSDLKDGYHITIGGAVVGPYSSFKRCISAFKRLSGQIPKGYRCAVLKITSDKEEEKILGRSYHIEGYLFRA